MNKFIEINFNGFDKLNNKILKEMRRHQTRITEDTELYYTLAKREYDYLLTMVDSKLVDQRLVAKQPVVFPVQVLLYSVPQTDEQDDQLPI